jgi:hypothetical protein
MVGNAENGGRRRGSRWRIAAWAVVAIILLLPLVAMQFSDDVKWGVFDFIVAGVLLIGTGLTYELAVRMRGDTAYRIAAGIALAAALLLIWINLAVGIIGNEENPANLSYFGVLAVGIIGAMIARLQPQGMARALFATALAQALVGVIALFAGWGSTGPIWPMDVLGATGFFAVLFVASALLFQQAARGGPDRGMA